MDSYSYVLGVIAGDASASITQDRNKAILKSGAIRYYPKKNYVLQLQCKDKEFAERFAHHLEQVVGRKPLLIPFVRNMKGNAARGFKPQVFRGFIVRIKDKHWCLHFREIKLNKAWDKALVLSQEAKYAFLQGLIDSEGHVSIKAQQQYITNTDTVLLKICQQLLGDFGIKTGVSRTDGPNGHIFRLYMKMYDWPPAVLKGQLRLL